jgi:hypothetical protein
MSPSDRFEALRKSAVSLKEPVNAVPVAAHCRKIEQLHKQSLADDCRWPQAAIDPKRK